MSHSNLKDRLARLVKGVRGIGALGALAAGVLTTSGALAQQSTFYLDRAQISGAPDDGLVLFRPHVYEKTRFYGALGLGYTLNPIHVESLTGDPRVQQAIESPLTHQLNTYVNAGVEILGRFAFGVSLPVALFQTGSGMDIYARGVGDNPLDVNTVALHDLRLDLKAILYQSSDRKLSLGVGGALWLPTGNSNSFAGDGQTTGWIYGAAEYDFGKFQITGLAGPHFRPNRGILGQNGDLEVGSELRWAAGVFFPLREGQIRLGGTLWGTTGIENGAQTGQNTFFSQRNTDAEWLAEARIALQKRGPWYFSGGGGTRLLTTGYGSPDVRVLAMIGTWTTLSDKEPRQRAIRKHDMPDVDMHDKDTDGDGYPDDIDLCPTEKEDGKPPNKSDGCPATIDRDGDGIPDNVDKCPDDPEDKDGILDSDGCPETDADNDGIPDKEDACPLMPGDRNPDPKKNGCKKRQHLVETKSGLELLETIKFDTAKATIKPESFPILDEVVSVLKDGPDINMGIYGHTDSKGAREMNINLSKARAASVVNYLVNKGINRNRLKSDGFGPDKPVDTNDTAEGRAKNRRVEFKVLE